MSVAPRRTPVPEEVIRDRRERGIDGHDEVWDGDYVMSPIAGYEHQDLCNEFGAVLSVLIRWAGLGRVFEGYNVGDRDVGWTTNFRVPDVAVFLNGNPSLGADSQAVGGPDFLVEILSDDDPAA